MGIVDWNANFWTTITLTDGTTQDAVSTAVNAMACCSGANLNNVDSSCCCCGTPLGGGIYWGAQMLLTSTRPTATKVLVVLTDGCIDYTFAGMSSSGTPEVTECDCSTEVACQADASCVANIAVWYQWAVQTIPGIKIIVVGVGGPNQICTAELDDAAGGNLQNVYNPTSWGSLSSFVETVAATACTVNDVTCDNCCGFCSCGQCITPNECAPFDACNNGVIDPNSGCCVASPINCTAPDLCHSASCVVAEGGCVYTPLPCPANDTCHFYQCNPSTGLCASQLITPQPAACVVVPPECNTTNAAVNCNDKNLCTNDLCSSGTCTFTPVTCPANTKCSTSACSPTEGCHTTNVTCNDNSVCTTDSCNPLTGCVFTNITCPAPKDFCQVLSLCDASLGCIYTTRTCPPQANQTNCTLPSCVNGSCTLVSICYNPPPAGHESFVIGASVGAALGTAAVAGIAIGAVVAAAGAAGGGAYAFSQAGGFGAAAQIAVNPLYKDAGIKGQNPLFKA